MDPERLDDLRRRWLALLAPYSGATPAASAFADVVVRHAALDRHYHTLDHIRAVLDTIVRLQPEASLPLLLAGWLHDVVYDPRANDNEEQSARYALDRLPSLGVPGEVCHRAAGLIRITATHEADPGDREAIVLLDADLAILGAAPSAYDAYAAAIRREYSWVAEAEYRRGRRRVLERFQAREWIYGTEEMRGEAEKQARANLAREIAGLD